MEKLTLLLLFIFSHIVMGQNQKPFKIIGKSDYYNNKELLVGIATSDNGYLEISIDSSFEKVDYPMKYVKVKNNVFEITGALDYLVPMYIIEEKMIDGDLSFELSHIFFIESDVNIIKINNLKENQRIELVDAPDANDEFLKIRSLYKHLEIKGKSMFYPDVTDLHEKHRILNKYINEHPNSYVALWITILDYVSNGYLDEIFNNSLLFSDEIKSRKPYKTLLNKLNTEKTLVVGSPISMNILPEKYRDFTKNKYTLLEFWATWCKPCLALVPYLKKIHGNYKNKGFEIYGISNDESSRKALYEKTLKNYAMPWNNIMAPEVASSWNINSLPSNFLIDSEGVIVAIDINPEDLEKLLKEKLK